MGDLQKGLSREAIRRAKRLVLEGLQTSLANAYSEAHQWGDAVTRAVQQARPEDARLFREQGELCLAVALVTELAGKILTERLADGSGLEATLAEKLPAQPGTERAA